MNKYTAIIQKEMKIIWKLSVLAIIASIISAKINAPSKRWAYNSFDNLFRNDSTIMENHYVSWLPMYLEFELINHIIIFSALAIIIALYQFWVPNLINNWKFTLHRPISRNKQLALIMASALIPTILLSGIFWTRSCNYYTQIYPVPFTSKFITLGWINCLFPIVCYLTTALVGLSKNISFIGKLPILALLTLLGCMVSIDSMQSIIILCSIYICLTTISIFYQFNNKEF